MRALFAFYLLYTSCLVCPKISHAWGTLYSSKPCIAIISELDDPSDHLSIYKKIPAKIYTPRVKLNVSEQAYLDRLLNGTEHSFQALFNLIKLVTSLNERLKPVQKQTLAIRIIKAFNQMSPIKYLYNTRLKPNKNGDRFLCSEECAFVMVFESSGKVFLGEYQGYIKNFDTNAWQHLLVDTYQVQPQLRVVEGL